jgi:hypothetical protein
MEVRPSARVLVLGDHAVGKSALVDRVAAQRCFGARVGGGGSGGAAAGALRPAAASGGGGSGPGGCRVEVVAAAGASGDVSYAELWDVDGARQFDGVRDFLYRAPVHGLLLVYDQTRPRSRQRVHRWIADALGSSNFRWRPPEPPRAAASLPPVAALELLPEDASVAPLPVLLVGTMGDLLRGLPVAGADGIGLNCLDPAAFDPSSPNSARMHAFLLAAAAAATASVQGGASSSVRSLPRRVHVEIG